ncbi:unnamed protein product [Musa banksii]
MDSSSPPPLPCFHGYGRRWLVLLGVLVPMVLVSLVLFAVESKSSAFWFSSYSLSSPPVHGGDMSGEEVLEHHRGVGAQSHFNHSGHASHASPPPAAAPSPAPEPVSPLPLLLLPSSFLSTYIAPLLVRNNGTVEAIPSPRRARRRDTKLERLEVGLMRARAAIKEAFRNHSNVSPLFDKDYVPQGPSYRDAYAFHRSYLEMEKLFKVYVYEEGEPPLFHDGPCRSIYSSEGRFIHGIDMDTWFRTRDPDLAHVFFLPFSVVKMVKLIYKPKSFDISPITRTIADYISVIAERYPYWNRSLGADHFMLSCHDWGPHASEAHSHLYGDSIRVLCNANTSEGFDPRKDVSLPEINLKTDVMADMMGGPSASRRPVLAFFAGGDHGPVRPLLLQAWKGRDPSVQVHEYLPRGVSYYAMMRRSRFCLCPSGYEVASPRVVEAIYLGCVPVTISHRYVLPFSDVLNWKAFSVQVSPEDIPDLKRILTAISPRQYIRMQRRVRMVRRHFEVNSPPRRFDVFHMILHSVWLRRLNVRLLRHE